MTSFRPGFEGDNCDMPTAAAAADGGANGASGGRAPHHVSPSSPASDSGDEGTLAGILIVVFLGAVIISIMVYYRCHRRFKRLKTELAHVHYIPDPAAAAATGAAGNQGTANATQGTCTDEAKNER